MKEALQRLRARGDVPDVDPRRELALLEAFDRRHLRQHRGSAWWPAATAATLACVVFGVHVLTTRPAAPEPDPLAGFVTWPGAEMYPQIESASVVRVRLPSHMAVALGLDTTARQSTDVPADLLIAQDGLTRAVRLVHE